MITEIAQTIAGIVLWTLFWIFIGFSLFFFYVVTFIQYLMGKSPIKPKSNRWRRPF